METKARLVLVDALRDAQRWLDELVTNPTRTLEAIADREAKTKRALGLQGPTRTRDEPAANSNSGNGNLRPETFDRSRRQWAAETAEKTQQID
jgi:hypothetical protein